MTLAPAPVPVPASSDVLEPAESASARHARLALRRRLITWSIGPALVAVLLSLKFLTMTGAATQAVDGFFAASAQTVFEAADRMSFLNVVERHKAPFARGDGFVLAGDLDRAREQFEAALEFAPPDSVDSCQIRVNLALALERLGDAAKAAGDEAKAKDYWTRTTAVADAAPDGCFQPPADGAGQKAEAAGDRAEQKLNPQQQSGGDTPTDPQEQAEQQRKQSELDQQTQSNQQDRQQNGPDGQGNPAGGGGTSNPAAKPW